MEGSATTVLNKDKHYKNNNNNVIIENMQFFVFLVLAVWCEFCCAAYIRLLYRKIAIENCLCYYTDCKYWFLIQCLCSYHWGRNPVRKWETFIILNTGLENVVKLFKYNIARWQNHCMHHFWICINIQIMKPTYYTQKYISWSRNFWLANWKRTLNLPRGNYHSACYQYTMPGILWNIKICYHVH